MSQWMMNIIIDHTACAYSISLKPSAIIRNPVTSVADRSNTLFPSSLLLYSMSFYVSFFCNLIYLYINCIFVIMLFWLLCVICICGISWLILNLTYVCKTCIKKTEWSVRKLDLISLWIESYSLFSFFIQVSFHSEQSKVPPLLLQLV